MSVSQTFFGGGSGVSRANAKSDLDNIVCPHPSTPTTKTNKNFEEGAGGSFKLKLLNKGKKISRPYTFYNNFLESE